MASREDRILLDTNILFSAARSEDSDFQRLWQLPGITLIISTYILEEIRRHVVQPENVERLERLLLDVQVVQDWQHIRLPDIMESLRQKDIPIVQAAIAAQATHLVTGDARDFGDYFGMTIAGVEIIQPAEYLRRHSQGD